MGQRPRNPNKEGFTAKMPLYSGTIQQAIGLPHGWVHGGTLNWSGRAPPGRPALDESGLPPDAAVADPEKSSALQAECVGNDPGWLVPRLATRPGRSRLLGIRCAAVFSAVRVTASESRENFCPVFSRVFVIECRRGCEPPKKGLPIAREPSKAFGCDARLTITFHETGAFMNTTLFLRAGRVARWVVAGALAISTMAVPSVYGQDAVLDEDAVVEESPFENPQDISGGGAVRVGPGSGLKRRKLGVNCEPFREGSLRGVRILEVFSGTIAEQLGLEAEDVIVSVNTHPVRNPGELSLALATATGKIRLRVRDCNNGQIVWLRNTFHFPGGQVAAARAEESYSESDLQDPQPGVGEGS